MTAAAPGVKRQTEAAFDRSLRRIPSRVPALSPAHELVGDLQLLAIDLLELAADGEVLDEEIQGIHPQRRRQIVQGAESEERSLGMIGRPPGPGAGAVRRHRRVLVPPVGDLEDIGDGRIAGAAGTARGPGLRAPGDDRAVLLRSHLDLAVRRRPVTSYRDLRPAVQHQLHRRARQLGQLGALDAPAVDAELAAVAAAHVVGHHVDVGGRNTETLGELSGEPGHGLGGAPGVERVGSRPLADLAVGFHAIVGHRRHAVGALDLHFRGGHRPVGIAHHLFRAGVHLGGFLEIRLVDEVRQHLVLDLDGAQRLLR